MPNANHRVRPATVVITVMGTVLTLVAAGLIAMSAAAHRKAGQASENVLMHDGTSEAHPVLQERIAGNYEKIQLQIGQMNEKLDKVLKAVEK